MTKTSRIPILNTIRGMAILQVLTYHWYVAFYNTPIFKNTAELVLSFRQKWPVSLVASLFLSGYQGVHLFLFLSGFLLTYHYFHQAVGKSFLGKRLTKILLPYWPAWMLSVLTLIFVFGKKISILTLIVSFFYPFSLDIWAKQTSLVNPTFWFIGLIVQLYLLFPLLLPILKKLRAAKFLLVMTIFTLAARFLIVYWWQSHPIGALINTANGAAGFIIFPSRLFAFSLGMSISCFYGKIRESRLQSWLLMMIGAIILLWANLSSLIKSGWIVSDLIIVIGLVMLAYGLSLGLLRFKILTKFFHTLAHYAYESYLIHYPLMMAIGSIVKNWEIKNYLFVGFYPAAIFTILIFAKYLKMLSRFLST